jgi:hypothetical protein
VDPSGLAHWSAQLDAGISRAQVVHNIETSTTREFFANEVDFLFLSFLHRHVDPVGQLNGVLFLEGGGTLEQLAQMLVLTPEYVNLRAGGTAAGFLGALFQDALGRPIDPGTLAVGEQMLAANPAGGRALIANIVLNGPEFRGVLAAADFERFTDRPPNAAELVAIVNALQAGMTDETLAAILLSQDPVFLRANS